MHILHTVLYISLSVDKENLFYHQELLQSVIISIILVTWMRDPGGGYCKEKLDSNHF